MLFCKAEREAINFRPLLSGRQPQSVELRRVLQLCGAVRGITSASLRSVDRQACFFELI